MKPLILITPTFSYTENLPLNDFLFRVNSTYVAALNAAGALPVVAPETDYAALVQRADGVLFAGGVDLDPALYGEERVNDTVEVTPARDALELALFEAAMARRLPMLGICRGIQLLNVAFGGSLWQDIPSQLPEAVPHAGGARHPVRAEADSLAGQLFGTDFVTNSYHHQAVKAVGQGLRVTARAADGVIEAVEHEALPVWGFQWHPERMTGAFRPDDGVTEMGALFARFVQTCAEGM